MRLTALHKGSKRTIFEVTVLFNGEFGIILFDVFIYQGLGVESEIHLYFCILG